MSLFPHITRVRGHTIWTKHLDSGSVVVDAGAHRGEFSRMVHQRFGCRCVLIEANPRLVREIQPPEGGQVIHAALAAAEGSAKFVFRDNPEGGGIVMRDEDAGNETVSVNTVSLSTLRRDAGLQQIDLLKLDIEGAEFSLLEQTPDAVLTEIGQITVEFHDFLPEFKGRGLYGAARAHLLSLGFVCCPMSFRTHGDVVFLNPRKIGLSRGEMRLLAICGRWVLKLRRK